MNFYNIIEPQGQREKIYSCCKKKCDRHPIKPSNINAYYVGMEFCRSSKIKMISKCTNEIVQRVI